MSVPMSDTAEQSVTLESELIKHALTGDSEAFSRLMLHYARRIYRVAFFIVRNLEDAKDITQETFFRAYRSLQSFDPSKPLYPWLHRIARNLSLNYVGRFEHRNVGLPDEDTFRAETGDPLAAAIRSDDAAALYRAIDRLSPNHREIIMLKHFGECSYAEIAETLGIPIGTVMSRLYNARMKLKTILIEENGQ